MVDFFSVLRAYEDVSGIAAEAEPRFPGGFSHPRLLTELRLVVVRLLDFAALWELQNSRPPQIIGYSLPGDDMEIRTLLRAGVARGNVPPRVVVRNPEPGVHVRARTYINREAESDHAAFTPA